MATAAKAKTDLTLYLKLVHAFPLRPIRTEAELDQATAMMDALSDRAELAPEERDYWAVLAGLIEEYEDEFYPIPDAAPGDVLLHLIEARDTTQVQVAEDLGISVSTLNEFIKGKRGIHTRHMAALGRYFNVPPTVFFPEAPVDVPGRVNGAVARDEELQEPE